MTSETEIDAQVGIPLTAEFTNFTRNGGVNRHPFALAFAFSDHPREFVTENERLVQFRIADSSLAKPEQVRTADTDSRYAHQYFTLTGFRPWFLMLAQIAWTVQSDGFNNNQSKMRMAGRSMEIPSISTEITGPLRAVLT